MFLNIVILLFLVGWHIVVECVHFSLELQNKILFFFLFNFFNRLDFLFNNLDITPNFRSKSFVYTVDQFEKIAVSPWILRSQKVYSDVNFFARIHLMVEKIFFITKRYSRNVLKPCVLWPWILPYISESPCFTKLLPCLNLKFITELLFHHFSFIFFLLWLLYLCLFLGNDFFLFYFFFLDNNFRYNFDLFFLLLYAFRSPYLNECVLMVNFLSLTRLTEY